MAEDVNIVVAGAGDPALVNEIMRLIRRYCEANKIIPCPIELRDTMLSVAALTHLEAARMDCSAIEMSEEDFADAARARHQDVTGALAMPLFCTLPRPLH